MTAYFVRQPGFQFKPVTMVLFIISAIAAWIINIVGHSFFPLTNLAPYIVRTVITIITDLVLVYVSFRLLKQNCLAKEALGLSISSKTVTDIIWGVIIGILAISLIAVLVFAMIPYHFVAGSMGGEQAFLEGISYVVGNTLEELMFRGFLFILLSQLIGWRKTAFITALLFGLFHLQGIGLTINGLKMVITTVCFSFVFSFSFVLFRSMWTSISVHVMSNLLLHTITGLDGGNRAVYQPVFEENWPEGYDIGLVVMVAASAILSGILYLLIRHSDEKVKLNGRSLFR